MPLLTATLNLININREPFPLLATAVEAEDSSFLLSAVLLTLVVIYLASKIGGELCHRLQLPSVLGELIGGVVIGVSALHLLVFPSATESGSASLILSWLQTSAHLSPSALSHLFQAQSEVISVLTELGVILLLFEIGLESELKELLRVGPQALLVAIVGVIAPFTLGMVGLVSLFHVSLVPAIFAGAALTATSIGITAKVLAEMQQLKSQEGQIILGAAVLDDVLGIIILAIVSSLARDGKVELSHVITLILTAVVFLVGTILLGRVLSPWFVRIVNQLKTRGQLLVSALVILFALSYVASIIHLEAILGAFAAGLILAETEKRQDLEAQIKPITDMLVPVFFVVVGARTDVTVLNPLVPENRAGLTIAAFLVLVAVVGKVAAGWSVLNQPGVNRLAIGVGMVPRGEVGLVFAAVGTASGVLSQSLNSALVIMVIITTFLAPPLLRLVFPQPKLVEAARPEQALAEVA